MAGLLSDVDPDGLLEYSVVFTDRSLNHMSQRFQGVMNHISQSLKTVYGAQALAIVPGGGTYAMESVARQFATNQRCLIVRNGWFSYRWTQILETGGIASNPTVLKARPTQDGPQAAFAPVPVAELVERIEKDRPNVVFAPHVETASGILLPDRYLESIASAVHECGGIFVLDCVASGALWVDMNRLGVDVLISAPQKGWSATPCAGLVLLSERGLDRVAETTSSSFACDLNRWLQIMEAYENGGHLYHATMPTDGLTIFSNAIRETEQFGFENAKSAQLSLGTAVRQTLEEAGFSSVAAPGFEAPGVVVSYTQDPGIQSGAKFGALGLQTAAGVPLMCDEPEDFRTFRIGLFGLDKLGNPERTLTTLREALGRL